MLRGARPIAHNSLSPGCKYVAPRVAVTRRREVTDLERSRIDHVSTRSAVAPNWSPRRFDRRAHRDAFQRVQQTAVRILVLAERMMGVIRGDAVEELDDYVRPVIAVGVLKPDDTRQVGDNYAAIPEFEAGRAVQLVVKHLELRTQLG